MVSGDRNRRKPSTARSARPQGKGNPTLAKIQNLLGVEADGFWGPVSQEALNDQRDGGAAASGGGSGGTGFKAEASSFADPADVRAFERCKAEGKSDQACFRVGDNGIGQFGKITAQDTRRWLRFTRMT